MEANKEKLMQDYIIEYIKKSNCTIVDSYDSKFYNIFVISDSHANKKLIKYIMGYRRHKIAIKDVYNKLLSIKHFNIVEIYEIIEKNEDFFIIMEYIEGLTLNQYIKRNYYYADDRNLIELRHIFKNIALTIDHFNDLGILHTDIIGANIIIQKNLEIKIIDFDFAILGYSSDDYINIDLCSYKVMFFQIIYEQLYLNQKYDLFKNTAIKEKNKLFFSNHSNSKNCIDFLHQINLLE